MRPKGAKTWVEISRSNLRANVAAIRSRIGQTAFMAVVKSNAYGHGLPEVVAAVRRQADWFGVDSISEAEAAAKHAPGKPILMLGYTLRSELKRAVRQGFRLTLYDPKSLAAAAAAASAGRKARLHLKLETGTSRQGIMPADLPAFVRAAKKYPNVVIEGLSTHFANSEDADPEYFRRQLLAFARGVDAARLAGADPKILHAACSAAALRYPESRFTMVRSGIAMYGLWPSPETESDVGEIALRPALSWKTVVAQVKSLKKGTPVSYGLTEKLARDSRLAVLPVGYWDGFGRGHSSIGHALVNGRRAKVVGRVCMNMCMIDVTDCGRVAAEDEVVLIGRQGREKITAEEFAGASGTIHYEAVTRINPTLPRILIK